MQAKAKINMIKNQLEKADVGIHYKITTAIAVISLIISCSGAVYKIGYSQAVYDIQMTQAIRLIELSGSWPDETLEQYIARMKENNK
jgi:hypothetical protein